MATGNPAQVARRRGDGESAEHTLARRSRSRGELSKRGVETDGAPRRPAVLVLGAGFLGSAIARELLDRRCRVVVLTKSVPEEPRLPALAGARLVIGDVAERTTVASALADVDEVVYAIGSSSPAESTRDPHGDISVVVPPLVQILELLRRHPGVRLTFLSSGGAVYGNVPVLPVAESVEPRPISSYGMIKVTCERYIRAFAAAYTRAPRIVRIGNAYGPGQPSGRGQGVVAHLMRSAITGEVVPMYGADSSVRDYVYIDDVSYVIGELICVDIDCDVVNVGTGIGHSLQAVWNLVCDVTERKIPVRHCAARSFDVHANVLEVALLRSIIPYAPLSLQVGLTRTWQEGGARFARSPSGRPSLTAAV